jgi:tripartite-type tricarboxylate transporter receptor subunit TctC
MTRCLASKGPTSPLNVTSWFVQVIAGLLLWLATADTAGAQAAYPTRVVRIIVPFPAGGTADILPRIVGERLSERWGQAVIVENRSGAGGNIGAEVVAAAAPDGYVLLASPPGPIVINDHLYATLAFQPARFEPVVVLGTVPNVLLVQPAFPAKTVQELITYAKAHPNKVTFASQGNGSTSHLSAMLFQKLTSTQMVHVPYRGTAPALQDIMGNQVDMFFDNLGTSLPLHNAGNARILAVGSSQRAPALPDVPTLQEVGVENFQSVTWFAVMAPPGTPLRLTQAINQAIVEALHWPGVSQQFAKMGVEPVGGSVAATASFIAEERTRWGEVIRAANIKID